jgi:hypothetical protein
MCITRVALMLCHVLSASVQAHAFMVDEPAAAEEAAAPVGGVISITRKGVGGGDAT